MTNYYPEKPFVPYMKTPVEMAKIIISLKEINAPVEVKRATYIIARNESANGRSVINNNLAGFQADSGRWDAKFDSLISGVVKKTENKTGKERYFLAFNDVSGCLTMLVSKVQSRGLFIGGTTSKITKMNIQSANDLARAYKKEWVTGLATAEPTSDELNNFLSMYNQSVKLFA